MAESVNSGKWDVSVLAEEPARAKDIAFADATTEIEATYMVPPGSPLQKIEDVDRPGVRIALGAKSGYDLYLTRTLKHAQRVPVQLGRSSVTSVEVVRGLEPGDRIILSDMSQWDGVERIKLK